MTIDKMRRKLQRRLRKLDVKRKTAKLVKNLDGGDSGGD